MSTTIQTAHLLMDDGWCSPAHLIVDAAGTIERVGRGAAESPDLTLPGYVVPGMPNVHSHAHQRGLVGYADRLAPGSAATLWSWRALMYRHVLALQPEDLEAYATLAYIEMLHRGYTSVGEFHYVHHGPNGRRYASLTEMSERLLAAAKATGISITVLPVLYTSAGVGRPAEPEQRRFTCTLDEYLQLVTELEQIAAQLDHVAVGVAPHSLRAVQPDELRLLLGERTSGPVHIHAAERTEEVEEIQAALHARPVEWLMDKLGLDQRWCLIHATHLTASERQGLARSGAVAGLCPLTEANLGDGLFPLADYRHDGGRLAVGTDANHLIDLAGELRILEYGQRLVHRRRETLLDGTERSVGTVLHRLAGLGGAQAIAQPCGRLQVGSRCDLVELDPAHWALTGQTEETAMDAWIFSSDAQSIVRTVLVAGVPVVQDGRHPLEEDARNHVNRVMRRLHAQL